MASLKYGAEINDNWFYFGLSLFISYVIAALILLRNARRRPEPDAPPAAAGWPTVRLTLVFVVALVVFNVTVSLMDLSQSRIAAARENLADATFASLAPPSVPDAENAAVIYGKAFALIEADQALTSSESPLNQDDADPNDSTSIALLKRHEETIALLRQAARVPACRFDRDWSRPTIQLILPNLTAARTAANLLKLHARNELANGRADSALTDVETIFGLAGNIGREPILVSALVSNGLDELGFVTLQDVLPALAGSQQLSQLDLPTPPQIRLTMQRALHGEECFGTVMFSRFQQGTDNASDTGESVFGGDAPEFMNPRRSLARLFLFSRGIDEYQRLMDGYQRTMDKPYFQVRAELNQLTLLRTSVKHQNLIISIFTPSFDKAVEAFTENQAYAVCAQIAIAATRYRLDHGALPAWLDDLVPAYIDAFPLDPFDGRSLRLAVRDNQWIVYSVGQDLQDDGGIPVEDSSAPSRNRGDLVFKLKIASGTTRP